MGVDYSSTPISINGNLGRRSPSSYCLLRQNKARGFCSLTVIQPKLQTGFRIPSADVAGLISLCCIQSWFPGILLDRMLHFPLLVTATFKTSTQEPLLSRRRNNFNTCLIVPDSLLLQGLLPLAYLYDKSQRTEWPLYAHLMNQI